MRRYITGSIIVAVVLLGALISITLVGQVSYLNKYIYQELLAYTPPQAGNGKAPANSDNPLQGLTKVRVIIDSTPLNKISLSEEQIRNDVVSKLRNSGITVLG